MGDHVVQLAGDPGPFQLDGTHRGGLVLGLHCPELRRRVAGPPPPLAHAEPGRRGRHHAANTDLPAAVISVYSWWQYILLGLAGLVIAVAAALGPAGWAARTRTAFALRAE
jgi:ABC-type lipoprotein release transport system permease subunit